MNRELIDEARALADQVDASMIGDPGKSIIRRLADALEAKEPEYEYSVATAREYVGNPILGTGPTVEAAIAMVHWRTHKNVELRRPHYRTREVPPGPWLPVPERGE